MLKLTRTKSGMSILTIKALGLYANLSCGKSAKRELTAAQRVRRYEIQEAYQLFTASSFFAGCVALIGAFDPGPGGVVVRVLFTIATGFSVV